MQALIDALFKQALQQAASVPVVTDKDAVHVDEAQRVGKRGGHVAAVPFQRGGAGSVARSRGADGVGPAFGRCAAGFGTRPVIGWCIRAPSGKEKVQVDSLIGKFGVS